MIAGGEELRRAAGEDHPEHGHDGERDDETPRARAKKARAASSPPSRASRQDRDERARDRPFAEELAERVRDREGDEESVGLVPREEAASDDVARRARAAATRAFRPDDRPRARRASIAPLRALRPPRAPLCAHDAHDLDSLPNARGEGHIPARQDRGARPSQRRPALVAVAERAQVAVRVEARAVPVEPLEAERVVADDLDVLELELDAARTR